MGAPRPDRAAAAALGAALRRLGYDEHALTEQLGEDAYTGGRADVPVAERRLRETPLAVAIRLLFLERPVARRDAVAALDADGVGALERTGLVEARGDELVPRSRIVPVGELLLCSDGFTRDAADPPDYVASYTPTARILDLLTPRPRVRRALDVGTGSGIHALLAARHSAHVVAVDVNPKALAYTALNAALNGLDNIETRAGSFFEPVAGERFDLITCNAPYVVSPESRWIYRDSGFRGDDVTRHIVLAAADYLADDGYAALLGSWLVREDDEPEARPVAWVGQARAAAWILVAFESDALEHAASWNAHFAGDELAYAAALDEWTAYLAELGAAQVAEGAILLHRGERDRSIRVDEIDEETLEPAAAQVRRAFENRERLTGLGREHLLAARLARALPLRLERELGRSGAELVLGGGTGSAVPATAAAAALVERLDGKTSLRRLRPDGRGVSLVRELLELGALRFV